MKLQINLKKYVSVCNGGEIDGLKISEFKNKFGDNPIYLYRNELKKLSDEKLIIIQDDNIRLSNKGIDLANLVWEEFV